jgi:hypothetical protein
MVAKTKNFLMAVSLMFLMKVAGFVSSSEKASGRTPQILSAVILKNEKEIITYGENLKITRSFVTKRTKMGLANFALLLAPGVTGVTAYS